MEVRKCHGTNRADGPCSATPQPGKPYCLWHDPARAAERSEWSRKGGRARSTASRARKQLPNDLMTLRDVQAVLCKAMRKLEAGEMTPAVANALGGLGRSIAAVAEAGDIEERLRALEERTAIPRRTA